MQLNIFLVITTLLIVKPSVNGLFLSEIGVEGLPLAFVLVAIFAVLISTIYARFIGQVPFIRIILSTFFVSVVLFIAFGILLRLNVVGGWVLYAFYIWVAIFGVLTASQFWILANIVFNAREAKRLFGFIGAGAIAGGIFGGYLTTILAEWLGSENLLFVGAIVLALCIPNTIHIWKHNVAGKLSKFQRKKRIAKTDHPFWLIRQSSHLTYLAGIIGISVIVAKLVDYQFSAIAAQKISDPDELTAFFGLWFSNFNVISLLVQLLLTQRLVGTLGVGSSLFFLPISIFLGAVLVFFAPQLWAAIFIKTADGSLKQSVNKAAVELLALPIPTDIKNQTKTFIDVVVDSLATGLGGVLLIFLVNGLDLSTRFISMMIGGLILFWVVFVLRIRRSYLNAFKLNVQRFDPEKAVELDLANQSVIDGVISTLQSGNERQLLHLLRKLRVTPDKRFRAAIEPLLQHPSDEVKEESIRNLYFMGDPTLLPLIKPFTKYPTQRVKIAAFDFLIAHDKADILDTLSAYLEDDDHKVRLAALVSLAEESRDNRVLKEKFELEERLQLLMDEIAIIKDKDLAVFYKIGLLKIMGFARLPEFFPIIEQYLADPNPQVAEQAILAAGQTMHPYFLPLLYQQLVHERYSPTAVLALTKYGPAIVDELALQIEQAPSAKMLQTIPDILAHFGNQKASDLLFDLLQDANPNVRTAALRSLNKVKSKYPFLQFYEKEVISYLMQEARLYQSTLSILYVQRQNTNTQKENAKSEAAHQARQELIQLLESRLDENLERIFRLLGLKYPPEDVISIYQSLQSQQPDMRNNALEYLDNLLESGLKKVLMPIVETALLDTISEKAIRQLNGHIPDEMECYNALLKDGDTSIKRIVKVIMEVSN